MNKKQLYESIMRQVSKEVKRVLNEDYYDPDDDFIQGKINNSQDVKKCTVDLGLPSGLLWCTYNIGAFPGDKAEDWYGNQYAWGEIETKSIYQPATYSRCNYFGDKPKYRKKYISAEIEPENDVVTASIDDSYRMPTALEYRELLYNTEYEYVYNYQGIDDLDGILFTSKINYKTLFFPIGEKGMVWTSTSNKISSNFASVLMLDNFNRNKNKQTPAILNCECYAGLPVRGVKYC